jgi:hypothetical protein
VRAADHALGPAPVALSADRARTGVEARTVGAELPVSPRRR